MAKTPLTMTFLEIGFPILQDRLSCSLIELQVRCTKVRSVMLREFLPRMLAIVSMLYAIEFDDSNL